MQRFRRTAQALVRTPLAMFSLQLPMESFRCRVHLASKKVAMSFSRHRRRGAIELPQASDHPTIPTRRNAIRPWLPALCPALSNINPSWASIGAADLVSASPGNLTTIFAVPCVGRCAKKGAAKWMATHREKRSRIQTDPTPVRGNLGTLWAQFRHNSGTNDLATLQITEFK